MALLQNGLEGTIYRYFILPKHTLTFIGFDWLQPLPGKWMYAFNAIMALFAFGIAVGYKYRVSVAAFTVMWTAEYLMQKSWYNNHYYLVILLCIFLFIVPANKYASIDSRKNPSISQNTMPYWSRDVSIFVTAKAGINAHEQRLIVDPNVDLAKAGYNYFGHDKWVILYDDSQLFN